MEWFQRERFCVTGGVGALGSRLVKRLLDYGARQVIIFDQRYPLSNNHVLKDGAVQYVISNILEQAELIRTLNNCTTVFHLAALTHASHSQIDPIRYLEVNGLGTARVLEACRLGGVRQVIYASTSHVYGIPRELPVSEDHQTMPLSVYAASKLAGEVAIQGYVTSCELSATVARLSNVYGAPFGPDTVIGRGLDQIAAGGPIQLRNLTAVRDFIYVDDVVEALVRLATIKHESTKLHLVNVCTARGISIYELAHTLVMIAERHGFGRREILTTDEPLQEKIPALILDNSRLKELTGWLPQVSLEEGLAFSLRERMGQEAEQV